jgi:proton-translocating NADH-quinone oxidoreductase chain N
MTINTIELKKKVTCYLMKNLEYNEMITSNILDFNNHTSIYFFNDIKTILPELFYITSILILTIYGSILAVSSNYKYPLLTRNISWLCILILGFTFLLTFNNIVETSPILTKTFINDDLSNYSKIIILLSSIACLIISQNYIVNNRINSFEYYLVILLSILGLLLLVTSYDLLSVYLALELQSLSFYILASFKRNSTFSTEAGLKYFILGAFASGLILFGISLIYGFTGSTNLESLSKLFYSGFTSPIEGINSIKIGILFVIVGFLFKLAAAPFHV